MRRGVQIRSARNFCRPDYATIFLPISGEAEEFASSERVPDSTRKPHALLIALGLVVLTVLAYWRVGSCGFVNLDDDAYVEFQPLVNQGIRSAGLAWAFTSSQASNWHPLTTLSHMLDCSLFGLRPAPMHWENVIWHGLNSILVFLAWRTLTGAPWRAALIAALFALHPLHVESVAWISERKDVLHACFWLAGLIAYAAYVRAPSWRRYLLVAFALVLALLSKPMAVTFPCTLLLLDFWPLARWPAKTWRQLFLEKAPLFALVLVHSALTFLVQSAAGAANYGTRLSLDARLGNAVVAYLRYLGKTTWPESLSAMYFHPGYWPAWLVVTACAVLGMGSYLAWRFRHSRPWLAFGALWFLGTLVPVIGLVQVGAQAMADRYMYMPMLGVLTIAVWEVAALGRSPKLYGPIVGAALTILVACGGITYRQVGAWKNSITLHEHSIAVGEDNPATRFLLGSALASVGRAEPEVVAQFRRALALRPDYVNALTRLAMIAASHQQFDEAQTLVESTVQFEPNNPQLHANLGALALRRERVDEAMRHFQETLTLDPKSGVAHLELGRIYLNRQQYEQGRIHYEARARLSPWDPEAQCDYGTLLMNLGRPEEGRVYLERAIWLNPDFDRAKQNLAALRYATGAKQPQVAPGR